MDGDNVVNPDNVMDQPAKKRKVPRRQHVKPPRYPGMATLDDGLNELPQQVSRKTPQTSAYVGAAMLCREPHYRYNETHKLLYSERHVDGKIFRPSAVSFWPFWPGPDSLWPTKSYYKIVKRNPQLWNEIPDIWTTLGEFMMSEVEDILSSILRLEKIIRRETRRNKTSEDGKSNFDQLAALHALHTSLLQEQHDFMLVMQHSDAPDHVKKLAAKYYIPQQMWETSIHSYLEYVRQNSNDVGTHMLPFIAEVYEKLDSLQEKVPLFKDQWDLISRNLHNYLLHLTYRGIDIPQHYLSYWPSRKPPDDNPYEHSPDVTSSEYKGDTVVGSRSFASDVRHRDAALPPTPLSTMATTFPTFSSQRAADTCDTPSQQQEETTTTTTSLSWALKESAKCFMAGWLVVGARVASSLYAYAKTFKYLAWVGATF